MEGRARATVIAGGRGAAGGEGRGAALRERDRGAAGGEQAAVDAEERGGAAGERAAGGADHAIARGRGNGGESEA